MPVFLIASLRAGAARGVNMKFAAVLLSLSLGLSACGQKGPLYLPQSQQPNAGAAKVESQVSPQANQAAASSVPAKRESPAAETNSQD